jgi:hypothetical protein
LPEGDEPGRLVSGVPFGVVYPDGTIFPKGGLVFGFLLGAELNEIPPEFVFFFTPLIHEESIFPVFVGFFPSIQLPSLTSSVSIFLLFAAPIHESSIISFVRS